MPGPGGQISLPARVVFINRSWCQAAQSSRLSRIRLAHWGVRANEQLASTNASRSSPSSANSLSFRGVRCPLGSRFAYHGFSPPAG